MILEDTKSHETTKFQENRFLTRRRMLGLLYMLKVVQFGGERVGEEEYKELEHREQMKKGMKKVMQSKDLRVGLLMMMATMDQAAGNKIGEEKNEDEGYQWIVFLVLRTSRSLGPDELATAACPQEDDPLGMGLYDSHHGDSGSGD